MRRGKIALYCTLLNTFVSQVAGSRSRCWKFKSPLYISEEPACVALGKLQSPRVPPEEGKGKPLLNILYLENPASIF